MKFRLLAVLSVIPHFCFTMEHQLMSMRFIFFKPELPAYQGATRIWIINNIIWIDVCTLSFLQIVKRTLLPLMKGICLHNCISRFLTIAALLYFCENVILKWSMYLERQWMIRLKYWKLLKINCIPCFTVKWLPSLDQDTKLPSVLASAGVK